MKLPGRKAIVVAFVVVATLVPLLLAGVGLLVRTQSERQLVERRGRAAELQLQLEAATNSQAPPPTVERRWQLLDANEVAATLQAVQAIVDGSGVILLAAKAAPTASGGRQTFTLTGRGRPEQVCALVAGIEQSDRLIVVESGRISACDETTVGFEFGLATYHRGGER